MSETKNEPGPDKGAQAGPHTSTALEENFGTDAGGLPQLDTKRYDPEPGRDKVRAALALILVSYLGIIILVIAYAALASLGASGDSRLVEATRAMQLALNPLTGLVGAATGFYFGASQR